MRLKNPETYFDVNTDSRVIGTTLDHLTDYLARYDKQLDKQIQRFYSERTIRYFRMSLDNETKYIASSCYVEYKKGISYEIDILFDKTGAITEAQCEYPAGEGPNAHCKHVCTVVYGAIMFTKNKEIKAEQTEKLQSFHKCKRIVGSPLKSQNLDMPGADEITNIDFDPRPEHLRNAPAYQYHFRNTCLTFPGISEMPIFQTFEQANTLALAHDHDYLLLTPEDNFLESISVLNIRQEKHNLIEERTRDQSKSETWKVERSKPLTSSMFGRICKATERT